MLWKASFFICWIAGQLPVQRTISCVFGGNQGGFTEAIPAGRQKPAPPEGKKGSRSQACVVEVSPHPTSIKETSEAPGAVTPTVGGARWSRQALWGCTLVSNTVLSALGCSKAGQAEALAPSRPTSAVSNCKHLDASPEGSCGLPGRADGRAGEMMLSAQEPSADDRNKAPWTVRKPPQPIGPESREEHDLWATTSGHPGRDLCVSVDTVQLECGRCLVYAGGPAWAKCQKPESEAPSQ
uniref:Uncharacterized protein n=1 Tax=Rangifer tarandus platyrhynchus TaxID=3082113 RepID=A0ACB0E6H3_RANTA|nr:unnamed protein product [Rangifer tarandus platyrhynchus]